MLLNLPGSRPSVSQSFRPTQNSPANHKCFVDFVATGRGSAEPVIVFGKEDLSLSRRVVFKIRVKSLEQRALETRLGVAAPGPTGAKASSWGAKASSCGTSPR